MGASQLARLVALQAWKRDIAEVPAYRGPCMEGRKTKTLEMQHFDEPTDEVDTKIALVSTISMAVFLRGEDGWRGF